MGECWRCREVEGKGSRYKCCESRLDREALKKIEGGLERNSKYSNKKIMETLEM